MSIRFAPPTVAVALPSFDETAQDPINLTHPPTGVTNRIRADDLSYAQTMRARIRRAAADSGSNPDSVSVILDVEVHIAMDARTARMRLAQTHHRAPNTVRYVGTAAGLAGLIGDIKAANVADGVVLTILIDELAESVLKLVGADTIPLLRAFGTELDPAALHLVLDQAKTGTGRCALIGADAAS